MLLKIAGFDILVNREVSYDKLACINYTLQLKSSKYNRLCIFHELC